MTEEERRLVAQDILRQFLVAHTQDVADVRELLLREGTYSMPVGVGAAGRNKPAANEDPLSKRLRAYGVLECASAMGLVPSLLPLWVRRLATDDIDEALLAGGKAGVRGKVSLVLQFRRRLSVTALTLLPDISHRGRVAPLADSSRLEMKHELRGLSVKPGLEPESALPLLWRVCGLEAVCGELVGGSAGGLILQEQEIGSVAVGADLSADDGLRYEAGADAHLHLAAACAFLAAYAEMLEEARGIAQEVATLVRVHFHEVLDGSWAVDYLLSPNPPAASSTHEAFTPTRERIGQLHAVVPTAIRNEPLTRGRVVGEPSRKRPKQEAVRSGPQYLNLVPKFLEVLRSRDRVAAYLKYFDTYRPLQTAYWENYVLDPDGPHFAQVVKETVDADRSDLMLLLERTDIDALCRHTSAICVDRLGDDVTFDLIAMVGVGAANGGELVVQGRAVAFVCLEHYTDVANPETMGIGLGADLLPLWIAHEIAHAYRYTAHDSRSELANVVRESSGNYSYWETGRKATLLELIVNEGLAVETARELVPGHADWEYYGYGRRQFKRVRDLSTRLMTLIGPDLDARSLGLRLVWLSGGMSDEARTMGGVVMPERAGYYLGSLLVRPAIESRGLRWAVRASAIEIYDLYKRSLRSRSHDQRMQGDS